MTRKDFIKSVLSCLNGVRHIMFTGDIAQEMLQWGCISDSAYACCERIECFYKGTVDDKVVQEWFGDDFETAWYGIAIKVMDKDLNYDVFVFINEEPYYIPVEMKALKCVSTSYVLATMLKDFDGKALDVLHNITLFMRLAGYDVGIVESYLHIFKKDIHSLYEICQIKSSSNSEYQSRKEYYEIAELLKDLV